MLRARIRQVEKAERERRVASVRFWEDEEGRLYTDEQLLRHIAHYGSLGAALAYGDIRLVSESPQLSRARPGERPRLADYLEEA